MLKDKEAFQRLSFLYQAAHCVLAQNPENQELARFYCHTQNSISRRLVLRQDPSVKRTICKACFSLLVPGISSTVRQRRIRDGGGFKNPTSTLGSTRSKGSKQLNSERRNQRWTSVQCLNCGLTKRFLSNPEYKLWSEQPEALLENQIPAGQGAKGQAPSSVQQQRKGHQVEKATASSSGPHNPPAPEETTVCTKSEEKTKPSGK
nr:ribonuclease P protein subunit p21 isoform X1 [Pogona vitticeps]XP_020667941.1 ribonuclease P protein subunit p21 isoform X1 [Pogona vitticeps]